LKLLSLVKEGQRAASATACRRRGRRRRGRWTADGRVRRESEGGKSRGFLNK